MATATKGPTRKTSTAKRTIRDYPAVIEGRQKRQKLRDQKEDLVRRVNARGISDDERRDITKQVRAVEEQAADLEHELRIATLEAEAKLRAERLPQYKAVIAKIDEAFCGVEAALDDLETFRAESKADGVTFNSATVISPEPLLGNQSVPAFSRLVHTWRERMQLGGLLPRE